MLWPSLVHPWWHSSYTSHLHVKINPGAGSERGCDTLSARGQGTVQYSCLPGPAASPKSRGTTTSEGKYQWHPIPLAIAGSGAGHVTGQRPCPLRLVTPIRAPCSEHQLRSSFGLISFGDSLNIYRAEKPSQKCFISCILWQENSAADLTILLIPLKKEKTMKITDLGWCCHV